MMMDVVRVFKALGDETRLRMIHILSKEEVTSKELGQVLNLGQSRVSAQLAVLREALPLRERPAGRAVHLSLPADDAATRTLLDLIRPTTEQMRTFTVDAENLQSVLARRRTDEDVAAGDLGRRHLPGRTWEGFARALLHLVPRQRVADVGIGDGDMTLLLASFAETLLAVDPSEATLARVRKKARRAGHDNIELLRGEIEDLPFPDGAVDLVVVSQVLHLSHDPEAAVAECARVLAPSGRLLVLDLKSHDEAWVREKLGHVALGFSEPRLRACLEGAGLARVAAYPVARDRKAPHFVTILATGEKVDDEAP